MLKTDEFSSVFSFRKRLQSPSLELLYRPNTTDTARLGLIVAKRHIKSAVARNRVKRVIREVFRLIRGRLPKYDIVVRIKVNLAPVNRRTLQGEVQGLFDQLIK